MKRRTVRSVLFFALLALSIGMLINGCAALNKADPADTGNAPAQIATVVSQATTQPTAQGAAAVATVATGFPVTTVLSAVGGLATILAGVFGAKAFANQAHLNTAQAAAGVTSNAEAIATLVSNNSPAVKNALASVNEVATTVGQVAQAVAAATPTVTTTAAAAPVTTAPAAASPPPTT